MTSLYLILGIGPAGKHPSMPSSETRYTRRGMALSFSPSLRFSTSAWTYEGSGWIRSISGSTPRARLPGNVWGSMAVSVPGRLLSLTVGNESMLCYSCKAEQQARISVVQRGRQGNHCSDYITIARRGRASFLTVHVGMHLWYGKQRLWVFSRSKR
jgi:hypothetical protein